jgi:hypothetical protein
VSVSETQLLACPHPARRLVYAIIHAFYALDGKYENICSLNEKLFIPLRQNPGGVIAMIVIISCEMAGNTRNSNSGPTIATHRVERYFASGSFPCVDERCCY